MTHLTLRLIVPKVIGTISTPPPDANVCFTQSFCSLRKAIDKSNILRMTSLDTILETVSTKLPAAGVDCLLIGGFAVNYYGYTRNTLDIDFMFLADHQAQVKSAMTQAGFINVTILENVLFFSAPGSSFRVDFLRTDSKTMQMLLMNAGKIKMHGHEVRIPALKDLIAMKVFALSNNQAKRAGKDLPDIAYLTVIHDLNLDSDIRPICTQFGTSQTYDLICNTVKELRAK